jgi:uridine kinase
MSYVVSVSAPVGGGKSSLATGLAGRLPDAEAIYFDSYEDLTARPLDEIHAWMQAGADPDEFVIPRLPEALDLLKRGESVVEPGTDRELQPAKYIVFETPFARHHRATGRHIDLSIWIDTPLDVALARNIREFTERPGMYGELAPWLRDYLDSYLGTVRELLCMQQEVVGGSADLVLDGLNELEVNVERAAAEILQRLP